MKRYLIFFGDCYYPQGGMKDYYSDYDEKDNVLAAARAIQKTHSRVGSWWIDVYDTEIRESIYSDNWDVPVPPHNPYVPGRHWYAPKKARKQKD